MAKEESKIILEREYTIPLRKEWRKVPEYKRANKAAKAIKEFMVRHMKNYDRDLKKIKIDILLNNELRVKSGELQQQMSLPREISVAYFTGIVTSHQSPVSKSQRPLIHANTTHNEAAITFNF